MLNSNISSESKREEQRDTFAEQKDILEVLFDEVNECISSSLVSVKFQSQETNEEKKVQMISVSQLINIDDFIDTVYTNNSIIAQEPVSKKIEDMTLTFFEDWNKYKQSEKTQETQEGQEEQEIQAQIRTPLHDMDENMRMIASFIQQMKNDEINISNEVDVSKKLYTMQKLDALFFISEKKCYTLQNTLRKELLKFEIYKQLARTIRENLKQEDLENQEKLVMDKVGGELGDFFKFGGYENIIEKKSQPQLCQMFSKYVRKNKPMLGSSDFIDEVLNIMQGLKHDEYIEDATIDILYEYITRDINEIANEAKNSQQSDCYTSDEHNGISILQEEYELEEKVNGYGMILRKVKEPRLRGRLLNDYHVVEKEYKLKSGARKTLEHLRNSNHN